MTCLDCHGPLTIRLDFGLAPIVGFPSEDAAPLRFASCHGCGLVQLADRVDPSRLYRRAWYRSGVSEAMRAELADVVRDACERVPTARQFLDIGANDGTLLAMVPKAMYRVGVDPSECPARVMPDQWFTSWPPTEWLGGQSIGIITSIAMWNHVRHRQEFIAAVRDCLAPDGVWIVQWQDLAHMVEATAFGCGECLRPVGCGCGAPRHQWRQHQGRGAARTTPASTDGQDNDH
jgi:hypothetical protein